MRTRARRPAIQGRIDAVLPCECGKILDYLVNINDSKSRDRSYGRRLLYLIGLVVFTCASALCGFAVSTLMLQLPSS